MHKIIGLLLIVIVLTSCSLASAKIVAPTSESTPTVTLSPGSALTGIPEPSRLTPTLNPTDIFITQVMGEKYAAQTQYAALPTVTPTPTIPPHSAPCQPGELKIVTSATGATGRIMIFLQVTNIGTKACFLPSWPQVQLQDRSAKPIQVSYDYIYPDQNPSSLPPTQESNPGEPIIFGFDVNQTADLVLMWADWCGEPVAGGVIIRILLLGANNWVDVPTDITSGGYCDDPSSPSTIDVIGFGY